jgi:hypothetical protein
MRNAIRQHIPNYVDQRGMERRTHIVFHSVEELLAIDFVKKWIDHPEFLKFSIYDEKALLVEYNDGRHFVVGRFFENFVSEELPKFIFKGYKDTWDLPPPRAIVKKSKGKFVYKSLKKSTNKTCKKRNTSRMYDVYEKSFEGIIEGKSMLESK